LAACSDSGDGAGVTASAGAADAGSVAASRYTTSLKGVCPDTVVVQEAWWPEVTAGYVYQLLGPDPKIDKGGNRVTGPLGGTGVSLEIRAGGPATGFQPVSSVLDQDDDILLGEVDTDEAVQNSASHPTVAVFAVYEKSPLALLWGDPSWHFSSVADVGRSGATVLVSESESAYVDVFVREGRLKEAQVDTSYKGSPDRFVAADGKIAQQGFVTYEPYQLEHDVAAWAKPVDYLLLADEYPVYQNPLVTRRDTLEANRACLSKLVPLFQRAQRDYITDPDLTNKLLLKAVDTLDTGGFTLSPGILAYGNAKQAELGLVSDGSDGVLGSFDAARVQKLIGRLRPVFEARGTAPKSGLVPADVTTNEFLDRSVSLK
jgi:hypothetical protein